MKRPEIIKQEIASLQKQLQESKNFYQFKPLCNSNSSCEMIGFFNIANTKKILTALYDGKKLLYKHGVYGNHKVYMNSQRNRILVENEDGSELETGIYNEFENSDTVIVYKSRINEDTIMSFIVWHVGEWYINTEN